MFVGGDLRGELVEDNADLAANYSRWSGVVPARFPGREWGRAADERVWSTLLPDELAVVPVRGRGMSRI